MTTKAEAKTNLAAKGLELPANSPASAGIYKVVRHGAGFAQTSALGPFALDGSGDFSHVGEIGTDLTNPEAREAAVVTGLNLVAALDHEIGVESVQQIVEVVVYLRARDSFAEHALVADGVSSVLVAAFGPDIGAHARTVVGV